MKKKIVILLCVLSACSLKAECQITIIIDIIKAALVKAIQAADLEVQRLQTQTIWLQNAQKTLENSMTELRLNDITGWVEKQKDLYQEYYTELWQVKQVIADYGQVRSIIELQARMIAEYRLAITRFKQDNHFSPGEISYMARVFQGILDESSKNMEQVIMVVNAFVTQMGDAERMAIINHAARQMQKNYNDLKLFNTRNIQLSLQRANGQEDLETVEKIYGLK
jgi:hypothetical protein